MVSELEEEEKLYNNLLYIKFKEVRNRCGIYAGVSSMLWGIYAKMPEPTTEIGHTLKAVLLFLTSIVTGITVKTGFDVALYLRSISREDLQELIIKEEQL